MPLLIFFGGLFWLGWMMIWWMLVAMWWIAKYTAIALWFACKGIYLSAAWLVEKIREAAARR